VFVAHQGVSAARLALTVSEELRGAGFQVLMHCEAQSGGSFKSQMKRADASGAQFAVIMGDDEVAEHQASIKALRSSDGAQTRVPLDQLTQYLIDATLDSSEFLPSDEVDHPSIEQ
jgi:histidyl-tRNA synthetase